MRGNVFLSHEVFFLVECYRAESYFIVSFFMVRHDYVCPVRTHFTDVDVNLTARRSSNNDHIAFMTTDCD